MLFALGLLFLFDTRSAAAAGSGHEASSQTLVLVQALFRHGNRTIDNSEGFSTDPHKDESSWMPLGFAQLTPAGRQTEYALGKFMRKRYNGFLSKTYHYNDISVLSSNTDRTLESAQLVCAGLYSPPVTANKWGEGTELGAMWQPIPIYNMPKFDIWLETHEPCPLYDKELEDVLVNHFRELNLVSKDLYEYLSKQTGEQIDSVKDVAKIFNALKIEEETGKQLPKWVTNDLWHKLEPFRALGLTLRSQTDLMKTIKAGPFMDLLFVNLKNKTSHSLRPDNKLVLYSGHDTTLVHLLNALAATKKPLNGNYGACIFVELHKISGQYFVQVYFLDNGLSDQIELLQFELWKKNAPIPIDLFYKMLDKYRISEEKWCEKCNVKNQNSKSHR